MSSFGAKRSKARKITVQDDDDDDTSSSGLMSPLVQSEPEQEPPLQATFKTRKAFKQSSLRRSINVNESDAATAAGGTGAGSTGSRTDGQDDDEEDTGSPVVRRPPLGRSGSTKSSKKRQSSSRLSFGPSVVDAEGNDGDGDSILLGEQPVFTPKKSGLVQTASENSAIKKGMARSNLLPGLNRLAMRSLDTGGVGDDHDDGRPRYSKEYLSELQNSTPNTPQNIKTLHQPTSDDEMSLDPSELEGAMIVDTETSGSSAIPQEQPHQTAVLTEAEIREKKERRARLAKQQSGSTGGDDFIALSDNDDMDDSSSSRRRGAGESYLTVLSRQSQQISSSRTGGSSSRSKKESRLRAEDEDLGEGFDEFVEDGGLSLGRKAEREARRKQRADMASLIQAAEGGGDNTLPGEEEDSDDSEAERRAAYEKAQTRAGMDGLKRSDASSNNNNNAAQLPPPKITPLPDLSVLVADFKAKMARKETELHRMRARIADLRAERDAVLAREPEVQKLLNEAGERYRALTQPGSTGTGTGDNNNDTNKDAAAAPSNSEAPDTAAAGTDGPATPGPGTTNMSGIEAARSLLERARAGEAGAGLGSPLASARGLDSLGTTPTKQQQALRQEQEEQEGMEMEF